MDLSTDLRCSVAVFRNHSVLLVHRTADGQDDWVLPGGSPEPGETTGACARREVLEETGLRVDPNRIAFVLETIDPPRTRRIVEIVFLADEETRDGEVREQERGMQPAFVELDELPALHIKPPLAGHLRGLGTVQLTRTAPYLGNLWRPGPRDRTRPVVS